MFGMGKRAIDISLITSTYRSEAFIGAYTRQALALAQGVHAAGLGLELVVVANDASETERRALDTLAGAVEPWAAARLLYIPRETLYASWNQGLQVATGQAFGAWNV